MTEAYEFTTNRALHCRGVALYMRDHAEALGLDPERAFLCGWLHDYAYAFSDNPHHAKEGGDFLRRMGYADWRPIHDHGTLEGLDTTLGVLLNIADMTIDSAGRVVGFDARLADVERRYGRDSDQYRDCSRMVDLLKDTKTYRGLGGEVR